MLPAVQWALNTAFRPRYGSTPYHVMFGRAPRTSFSVLANSSAGEWNFDVLDDDQIKRALKGVLELQEQFHVQVQERVAAERERRRTESSAGLEFHEERKCVRQESNSRLTFVTVYRLPIRLPATLTWPVV